MSKLFAELYTKDIVIEGEIFTIGKMSLKDQMETSKALEKDVASGSIAMIKVCVKKWVTADGVVVEISEDNIMRLCSDVVMKIANEISAYNKLDKEKEKN